MNMGLADQGRPISRHTWAPLQARAQGDEDANATGFRASPPPVSCSTKSPATVETGSQPMKSSGSGCPADHQTGNPCTDTGRSVAAAAPLRYGAGHAR